jgi:Zn ribbon nucleic-acid-binding protein
MEQARNVPHINERIILKWKKKSVVFEDVVKCGYHTSRMHSPT